MSHRPRVYIGSSTEGLPFALAVQANLQPHAESTVWKFGVVTPTDSTLEALDRAIDRMKFEYAILVLTPDDERDLRGDRHRVPRDNVLMELGLCMGRLSRARTFAVHHPDARLPINLSGIATCLIEKRSDDNHRAAVSAACEEIRRAITPPPAVATPPDPFQTNFRGYRNISESGFVEKTQQLIESSSEITFVGTGLNVLHHGDIQKRIVKRVGEGKLKATICFGNPFSPFVRHRLIEEERCDGKPEVAAEGIKKRVEALLKEVKYRKLPGLSVKLFNNYPTMSIFRFDSQKFVFYPMGYRKLGNECPVMFVEAPGVLADFLNEMIEKYLEDAVDAREVFRVGVDHQHTTAFVNRENVRAVAVYIIPDKESEFYKAGSELLGYDVLNDCQLPDGKVGAFRAHVGGARAYGFHLSASDLMYVEANQIPSLMSELRAIAVGAKRFELAVKEVAEGQFGENSLALVCDEPSGHLERLLTEITVRIRPMALGTNYTLDPGKVKLWGAEGLTPRQEVLRDAYQSPYVLSQFRPHFTLASPPSAPPKRDREQLLATAKKRFEKYLSGNARVPVDRLYVLVKGLDSPTWEPIRDDRTIWLH